MNNRGDGAGSLAGLLLIFACPLLCIGPLLVAALLASGVGRAILGPLGLAAGLVVAAGAVTWIVWRRRRRACACAPASPWHAEQTTSRDAADPVRLHVEPITGRAHHGPEDDLAAADGSSTRKREDRYDS